MDRIIAISPMNEEMNSDCYFEMGSTHTVCEDYVVTGKINDSVHFAIVSDGCSSSRYVDTGARILVHSAKKFLQEHYKGNKIKNVQLGNDADYIGSKIIEKASLIGIQLGLLDNFLDATLLIALSDGVCTKAYIFGDGGFVTKNEDGLTSYKVEFMSGAPYYLSYFLNEARKEKYFTEYPFEAIVSESKHDLINCNKIVIHDNPISFYSNTFFVLSNIEFISLMSDGVNTYRNIDKGEIKEIEQHEIIPEMVSYKNFNGKFVERRMKRIKKNCEDRGIIHYDDISVATINIVENVK